jgi:hypothetical protein
MITSKLRGHTIIWKDEKWCYTNGRSTALAYEEQREPACGHCGQYPTPKGHDRCLGTLPGVMNACCGHGGAKSAYVQFPDGVRISGVAALYFFEHIGDQACQSIS